MNTMYQNKILSDKKPVKRRFGGFTLIELLVVVLIIGILAAIALPQYQVAVAKSRYMQLIVIADAIKKANQLYYMSNGTYALDMKDLDFHVSECQISENGKFCSIRRNGKRVATCYLNDGTQNADGSLKPLAYCQGDDIYYSLRYTSDNRYCYATSTNKVTNQVCSSMGGVYQSEVNGLKTYLLP